MTNLSGALVKFELWPRGLRGLQVALIVVIVGGSAVVVLSVVSAGVILWGLAS